MGFIIDGEQLYMGPQHQSECPFQDREGYPDCDTHDTLVSTANAHREMQLFREMEREGILSPDNARAEIDARRDYIESELPETGYWNEP